MWRFRCRSPRESTRRCQDLSFEGRSELDCDEGSVFRPLFSCSRSRLIKRLFLSHLFSFFPLFPSSSSKKGCSPFALTSSSGQPISTLDRYRNLILSNPIQGFIDHGALFLFGSTKTSPSTTFCFVWSRERQSGSRPKEVFFSSFTTDSSTIDWRCCCCRFF